MNNMTELFAASHALIMRQDKFLVTKRAAGRNYMPNMWDLPGGTIEAGESPGEALRREISEEVSINVEIGPCLYVFNNMVQFPHRQTLQIVFLARYIGGEVTLNPREHSDFDWISKEEFSKLDKINFLEKLIEEFRSGALISESYIPDISVGW